MNNACPGCSTVYAVTPRDVGRRIKCKKCGMPLAVTDAGLVTDAPPAHAPPAESDPAPGAPPAPPRVSSGGVSGVKFAEFIEKLGGTPTVLFGLGTFLVIFFFFQPFISTASYNRADGALERVELEERQKLRKPTEDLKRLGQERDAKLITEDEHKIRAKPLEAAKEAIEKEYKTKKDDAGDDKDSAKISQKRSGWWDQNGLMFGFLFLSMGCIAYVRSESHLLVRILGGTILTLLLMAVFAKFSGCRG